MNRKMNVIHMILNAARRRALSQSRHFSISPPPRRNVPKSSKSFGIFVHVQLHTVRVQQGYLKSGLLLAQEVKE